MNANNIASPTTSGAAASSQPDQPKVGREAEKRYVEAIQGGAKKGLYSDEDKMGLVRLFILLGIESGNRSKVPEFKRKVVMRILQRPYETALQSERTKLKQNGTWFRIHRQINAEDYASPKSHEEFWAKIIAAAETVAGEMAVPRTSIHQNLGYPDLPWGQVPPPAPPALSPLAGFSTFQRAANTSPSNRRAAGMMAFFSASPDVQAECLRAFFRLHKLDDVLAAFDKEHEARQQRQLQTSTHVVSEGKGKDTGEGEVGK